MDLKLQNDTLLRPSEEFDFKDPPFDPIEFAKELVRVMIDERGVGLAATQVGVPYRVFALFTQPENTVMYNPRIIDTSEEVIELHEACLSYPGLMIPIERPRHIKVRFTQPNGEVRTEKYTGMTARAVQHELMHLDGKPFWAGLSRLKFERAKKQCGSPDYLFSGMKL